MKLTTLLILIAFLQVSARGNAQKVSLRAKNIPLAEVFSKIRQQTGYVFIYSDKDMARSKPVSLSVREATVQAVLDEVLKNQLLTYEIQAKTVFISAKALPAVELKGAVSTFLAPPPPPLLDVQGRVTDSAGNPLIRANVQIKGTARGTVTDGHGEFTLRGVNTTATLVISFVGYITREVPVNNRREITVTLREQATGLNDIVVVGYGQQRKISQIGAQSVINTEELKQPIANVGAGLAGRLAGLVVVQRTGEPGHDDADIWIRGIATINNSKPLILVDGVERSLSNLNYDDIASFSILKDASATAVYGVRGANGVVLITTKRGKPGKPEFSFDYLESVTTFTRMPKMTDGITYMNMANEALTTRGDAAKYTPDYIANTKAGKDPYLYPNVNWIDKVFKKSGLNRKATLDINGGAPSAFYYVSLGYYDEDGFIRSDPNEPYHSGVGYSRFNFTNNLTLKVTGTTSLEIGLQGYYSNGQYPGVNGGTNPADAGQVNSIFESVMDMPPVELPLNYPGDTTSGRNPNGGFRNPFDAAAKSGYSNQYKTQLYTNVRVRQQLGMLVKGLSFTTMFAFDHYSELDITHAKREDAYIANGRNADGSLNLQLTYAGSNFLGYDRYNGGNRRVYTESALNYDSSFGKHRVSALLLYNQSEWIDAFASDFTRSLPYRTRGLAGRATYSYNDRYFFEYNFGYNGSENFAPSKRYGFFPSYGLGWVASNEKFFEPLKNIISFLKFRFSSGLVGNSQVTNNIEDDRFLYLDQVNTGANGYTLGTQRSGVGGYQISSYAVNLTWENSHKTNIGMEMTLLRATTLQVDLFKEHRTGIFLQRGTVPEFVGLTSTPYGNLGVVNNAGVDISLQQNHVKIGRDLYLSLQGNFTYARNKIISNDQPDQKYPWMNRRGQNTNARFGYVAEGLFKDSGEIVNSAQQSFGEVRPGDIKFKDLNGDGKIDAYDQKVIGTGDVPFILYGFGFDLTYKDFSIGAFFQGQAKADIMLSGNSIQPFSGDGGEGNAYSVITDRWTPENPSPNHFYPRLAFGGPKNSNNNQTSTWWQKDASFIKLRTLKCAYAFPATAFQKFGIKSSYVYFIGENILTFSKFKLWDVELETSNGVRYPQVAAYSLGLHFDF
jgi:TonB-linked SusC/RagA family outer membrane protein